MVIKNEIYIVYRQSMEGRNTSPHYFLDKHHACKYAVVTKGKIAYNMPEVHKVTTVYNTENLGVNTYADSVTILSEEEIQQCAKEDE